MPVSNLRRVQMGQETTWGTSVAATAILMGVTDATIQMNDELYQTEQMGFMFPGGLTAEVMRDVEGSIEFDCTYEDIVFLLDGVFGDCTASGTESPYTWDYEGPTNAAVTPREYTIEFGMTDAEYEMAGAIMNDFSIQGDLDGDGVWQAEVDLIGKSIDTGTMASLSARSVELIRVADTKLYVDTAGGTIGSTEITGTLISFTLDVEPGYHLKHFNGSIEPASFGSDRWGGSLEVSLEYTSDAKAIVDALISAKVERLVRLEATSGDNQATIDFAGSLQDGVELFDDRDGNAIVNLSFTGAYNSTFGNWLKFQIKNNTNALP